VKSTKELYLLCIRHSSTTGYWCSAQGIIYMFLSGHCMYF